MIITKTMYSPEKPHVRFDFCNEDDDDEDPEESQTMIIEAAPNAVLPPHHRHHPLLAGGDTSSGGEDSAALDAAGRASAPTKKRAETWAQDETRTLIGLRREIDGLFNTSKSNKHLWEKISSGMREKGFDRSPTMCTDKWRNLLKEFKKAKQQLLVDRGGGSGKMTCYKEIEEILRERNKSTGGYHKSPQGSKVDSFIQFSDKASSRPTLNLERHLDHEGHPLAITAADNVAAGGVSPWNWRETPGNGGPHSGRVITVKWGDYTRRIGIDATSEAIKEAIRSSFRLRTKRAFWLEDEDSVVRALDRDMPLGIYTLHLDEGMTIKVLYEAPDHITVHTEEMTFYSDVDFKDFLSRRGWTCLREYNGYRNIDSIDDLCPGAIYRGVLGKSEPPVPVQDTIITSCSFRHPTRNRDDPIARAELY